MGRRKFAICLFFVVGMGLYWPFSLLVGANLAFATMESNDILSPSFLLPYFTFILAGGAIFVCADRLETLSMQRRVAVAELVVCTVCALVFILFGEEKFVKQVAYVGLCACMAVLLVFWGRIVSLVPVRIAAALVSLSLLLSAPLFFALRSAMSQGIPGACCVLLAVASSICLLSVFQYLCHASASLSTYRERRADTVANSKKPFLIVGALAVCVFADEIIRIFITSSDVRVFEDVGALTQLSAVIVASVVLGGALIAKDRFSTNRLLLILMPLMIAGFASFLLFPETGSSIPIVLLGASYWMLTVFMWTLTVHTVHFNGVSSFRAFAFMQCAFNVALLLSSPVGFILSGILSSGIDLSRLLAAAIIVVDISSMLLLWDHTAYGELKHSKNLKYANESRPESTVSALAQEYGLTARESDVLRLVVAGRNTPVIQRELSISRSTAQTHLRHIYQKFSVHSRQELLDRIENTCVLEDD